MSSDSIPRRNLLRQSASFGVAAAALAGAGVITPGLAQAAPVVDAFNVKDFGATGDGVNPDQGAIQAALDAARNAGGGIVFMPVGTYKLNSSLTVYANTTLMGVGSSPSGEFGTAVARRGTVLSATAACGAGEPGNPPLIRLVDGNTALVGLSIWYPDQSPFNIVPYPWTIQVGQASWGTAGVVIRNVFLGNTYSGIDLGTYECGRHVVEGVWGQPLGTGIYVNRSLDVGRIKNIHFWPFWSSQFSPGAERDAINNYVASHALGLYLRRADWEIVDDVFVWGYRAGLRCERTSTEVGPNALVSNLQFDQTRTGIEFLGSQLYGVRVTGYNYAAQDGYSESRAIDGSGLFGHLFVSGATAWGNLRQLARWNNSGQLSVSDALVLAFNSATPAIEILAGRAKISDCYFPENIPGSTVAVKAHSTADRVMVTGNQLTGNLITNQAANPFPANPYSLNHL